MKLKIQKKRFTEGYALITFILTLSTLYIIFISKYFGHVDFELKLDLLRTIESVVFITLLVIILPKNMERVSTPVLQVLFIFLISPTIVYYALNGGYRYYIYLVVLSFTLTCILVYKKPPWHLKSLPIQKREFKALVICMSAIVYITLLIQHGLPSLVAIDPRDVYEVRGTVSYASPIFQYFVLWQAKVLNPFLIGKYFINQKYKLLLIVCLLQSYLYLLTAHKLFVFLPILTVTSALFISKNKFLIGICGGICLTTVITWLVGELFDLIIFPFILITRLFFIQPRNQFYYYEYFSQNPHAYFTDSKLGFLFDDVYHQPIPEIVGSIYTDSFLNVAYTADSYAQLGAIGMFLIAILLVILLYSFEFVIIEPDELSLSMVVVAMFNLVNTNLTTSLLTHGIIFTFCLIYFYQSSKVNSSSSLKQIYKQFTN